VANDGERLARFDREAQVLASLNHPKIAANYGCDGVVEPGPVRPEFEQRSGPGIAHHFAQKCHPHAVESAASCSVSARTAWMWRVPS